MKRASTQISDERLNENSLIVDEYTENDKIYWKLRFSHGTRFIKINRPDDKNLQDHLLELAPIILCDSKFINSKIEYKDENLILTTCDHKIVKLVNQDGSLKSGKEIVKKISFQNINTNDISPISLESVNDFIKQGIEIYKIKGENNPYTYDDLERILNTTKISPITRKEFSENDIVKWDSNETLNIPICALNENKKRKVIFNSNSTLDFGNESESDKQDSEKSKLKIQETDNPINLICLIDKSGSMGSGFENVATKPFLDFIETLHKDSVLTLFTFNHNIKEVYTKEKIESIDKDNIKTALNPAGGTYFWGSILNVLEKWPEYSTTDNEDMKSLFLVITDGEDGASTDEELDKFTEMSRSCWNDINCYFMHPPTLNGSSLLNLPEGQCLAFDNDEQHTEAAINGLSGLVAQYSRTSGDDELPEIKPMLRHTSSQHYQSYDYDSNSDDDTINKNSRKHLTRFNTVN
jgi:hypothetical protein